MSNDRTFPNRIAKELDESREEEAARTLKVGVPLAIVATILCPIAFFVWWGMLWIKYTEAKNSGDQRKMFGLEGEKRIQSLLLTLPNNYTVYSQIRFDASFSSTGYREADFIVIGNGVFIIENKHFKGSLSGNASDRHWQARRTHETKMVRNPVQQVSVYTRLLSDIFKAKGVDAWITPLVTLSRDNGIDNIQSTRVTVLQGTDICDYIQSFKGTLSQENREKVIGVLEELRGKSLPVEKMKPVGRSSIFAKPEFGSPF